MPPLQPVQTQDLPPKNADLVEMQPIQVPFEEEMVQLVPELSGGHVPVFHQDGIIFSKIKILYINHRQLSNDSGIHCG